jgi:hypothetical protein
MSDFVPPAPPTANGSNSPGTSAGLSSSDKRPDDFLDTRLCHRGSEVGILIPEDTLSQGVSCWLMTMGEMMIPLGEESLEREFDMLMARNGLVVPPDRRAGTIVVYRELMRMTELLRQPMPLESEPSNIYSLRAILLSI